MSMYIKAKGKKDDLIPYLDHGGFSYDMEQALIKCGSGQERALLLYLLEGGYDFEKIESDICEARIVDDASEE